MLSPSLANHRTFCHCPVIINRGFFILFFYVLLHLPPLRFHCDGGCWDYTQDCCDFGIWQSDALTTRLDLIHYLARSKSLWLYLIHYLARSKSLWRDLIHYLARSKSLWRNLIHYLARSKSLWLDLIHYLARSKFLWLDLTHYLVRSNLCG